MIKPRLATITAGALALALMPFAGLDGLSLQGHIALGIFAMAALFWMFEPVPIYATSLLVIFLQVMLLSGQGVLLATGIADFKGVDFRIFTGTLAHPIILLFLGGFMLAAGAVKFDLDKALTRAVMKPFGTRPPAILLGLMLVTAMLSAFMSNTATTAMMMTVILPVVANLAPEDRFRAGVALSIPIAANIGGIATPIGTPPNAIIIAALANEGIRIPFGTWILLALPLVVVTLVLGWILLRILFPARVASLEIGLDGALNRSPKSIWLCAIFAFTVALWMTESLHGMSSNVIAFLPVAALPLFGILDKKDIRQLPWEVLWLVAGGISLGVSLQNTGLAAWMVGRIDWSGLGSFAMLGIVGFVVFVMANFLSHTVTATLVTPIVLGLGVGLAGGFDPVMSGLVIAVASSFGMVLPISTPPNAIAMSSGLVETRDMARAGLILGLCGLLITLVCAKIYWPLFPIHTP